MTSDSFFSSSSFCLRMCTRNSREDNSSPPSRVPAGHHHPCWSCGRRSCRREEAVVPQLLLFGEPFAFRLATGARQRYLLRTSKRQTSSKPQRSNHEGLTEISFSFLVVCFSLVYLSKHLLSSQRWRPDDGRRKHALRYSHHRGDEGPCLPPVLPGQVVNVSRR